MVVRVEEGESMASIARLYHTTVETIMRDNRLEDPRVHVGMRLVVHGYLTHVWLSTDDVDGVALRYGVTAVRIEAANDRLAVGCVVKIPV